MNRRQKIIISVTGIFIVLLILIGLTYGYFLTRITGNGNPTSISVTTANLELVYGDGTTAILTSSTPIEPGKFSSNKDFTVTNNGNALTDYAVTLEDFSITYANDTVINGESVKAGTVTKMEYPDDMKMEITCVIESDNEDRNGQACGNINGTLPTENSILLTNSIEVDDIHKYVLTLTYVDSGIDQSADMNKTIKGKIDIIDPKSTIDLTGTVASYQTGDYVEINSTPIKSEIVDGKYKIIGVEPGSHTLYVKYKDTEGNEQVRGSQTLTIKKGEEASVSGNTITFTDTSRSATVDVEDDYTLTVDETIKSSLRDAIIANAMIGKNGTRFVNTPPSKVAEEISTDNWNLGVEETVYYDAEYVVGYADDEYYLWDCFDGTGNCDLVTDYESCTSEVEKKYVFDEKRNTVYYVDRCENGKIVNGTAKYEKVLSTTLDDYGTSYYYRGAVEDNYVTFAGMCWRIVRIAGDGSTKLILEDQYTTCDDLEDTDGEGTTDYAYTGNWNIGTGNYGYELKNVDSDSGNEYIMNYLNPVASNTSSMVKAFYDFQTTKLADYTDKLKSGDWCLGDKAYTRSGSSGPYTYTPLEEYNYSSSMYYDAYTRLTIGNANGYQPTLKCNGTILNEFADVSGVSSKAPMYVSAITADEIVYAGGTVKEGNRNYYLINNYKMSNSNYFLSLSPSRFDGSCDYAFNVDYDGSLNSGGYVYYNDAFRPSVSLASSAVISEGEGTLESPYIIG